MRNSIMKIWTLSIIMTTIFPLSILSQQFYISANGGYGFKHAG